MGVIGSIRNRMGFLIVVFVGFALVAFILGDFLTTNRSFLGGNDNSLAVIAGEKISPQEFDVTVKQTEDQMKLQQNVETLNADQMDQARNQAWQQLLNDKLYGSQIEELGIIVSDDEVNDMVFGKFLHPGISGEKTFQNPATGQFDPVRVTQYLKQLETPGAGNPDVAKAKMQWVNFETGIRKERLISKYNDLITKGLYVTKAEAVASYESKGATYNAKFINLNYASISDSTVNVSESDLKNYYESHKWEFKQPETTASIYYAAIDVNPSAKDIKAAQDYIAQLAEPFKTATNDTAFIDANADTKFTGKFLGKGTMSPMVEASAFTSPVGTVIGPYEEGGAVKIAKVLAMKSLPDSVRARHLLVPIQQGQDPSGSKALADSLAGVLRNGGDWNSLVMQFSSDQGSKTTGGVYEWFTEGKMVGPFNDYSFQTKPGIIGVVLTEFGYHIIEVLTVSTGSTLKVQVGIIDRKVIASNETFEIAYQKADEFAGKNNKALNGEAFEKAAQTAGLTSRPADNIKPVDRMIAGVGNDCREVVRWIYNAKPGEVSRSFRVENKFVIVMVKSIIGEGYKAIEDVKDQLTAAAKREKKAQTLIEKANTALKGNTSIDAVAAKLNMQAMPAQGITFDSQYVPGLGPEPAVLGTLVDIKQGALSRPIQGSQGVFVITPESITKPPATTDYTATVQALAATNQNRFYEVFNALKAKAQIKDNRGLYY